MIEYNWMKQKGDCEQKGGEHEFYNANGETSVCYHSGIQLEGQLWIAGSTGRRNTLTLF